MSWKDIIKNLDEQVWYNQEGWNAVPSDETHRNARQIMIKTMDEAGVRDEIGSTPKDGQFHNVGVFLFGDPVLFKKDSSYSGIHRGEPTHFKLTGKYAQGSHPQVFVKVYNTAMFLKSKGIKLNKWPSIVYTDSKEELADYYTKMNNKARELGYTKG